MSVYNAIDGTVLAVTQEFLDDNDQPIPTIPGYPQVRLRDQDKVLLSSVIASPSVQPGEWTANLSIPNLGIKDKTELRIIWLFRDPDGNKYKVTDSLIVEPKVDSRISDIVAVLGDMRFTFVLPAYFGKQDVGSYQIYSGNMPLLATDGDLTNVNVAQITRLVDTTSVSVLLNVAQASLAAYLLRVKVTPDGGQERSYSYKMWVVTPQIMLGMADLENFLNKSRVEQVIPELAYTPGDLVNYLERGLYLFNQVGNFPSWFTGLNMQGPLYDSWIICSCYYALGAQLLAEGSLSFDFSGQGISLNVDRTPQLEAALGRIESAITDRVVPLKKWLAKQGTLSGDGSVGKGNMNNPQNIGTLGMINAATTRIRGVSMLNRKNW